MKQTLLPIFQTKKSLFFTENQKRKGYNDLNIPEPVKKPRIDDIKQNFSENSNSFSKYFNNHAILERSNTMATMDTMKNEKSIDFNSSFNFLKNENLENNKAIILEEHEKIQSFSNQTRDIIKEVLNKKIEKNNFQNEWEIPNIYKKIIRKFEDLDNSLAFALFRENPTFLTSLSKQSKITFTQKDFKQILFINQNLYTYSWEKSEELKNDYDLLINFPPELKSSKNIKKMLEIRKSDFKKSIIFYLAENQKIFLKEINEIQWEITHPFQFHPKFDIEALSFNEIVLIAKPCEKTCEKLASFLKRAQLKNQKLMGIMEETAKIPLKQLEEKEILENKKISEQTGISLKLLNMIKEREKKVNEIKEINMETEILSNKEDKKKVMVLVTEIIRDYFGKKKFTSVFLVNMIKYIKSANTSMILSEKEISEIIDILIIVCNDWLSVVDNEKGKILRINDKVQINEVLNKIREHKI